MMKSIRFGRFAASLAAMALTGWAWGDSFVWKGGTDASWNTAANWEPATVPNAAGAEVDLSAASGTITLSDVITIGHLTFSPGATATLTLSGANLTFSAEATPTLTVGSGATLVAANRVGGPKDLRKLGPGTYKPVAYNADAYVKGKLIVAEGTVAPTYKGSDGYPAAYIQIEPGATFTQTHSDMYGSWQHFNIYGGTYNIGVYCDYIHDLNFQNGGKVSGSSFLIQDCTLTPKINASGTGFAGLYDACFRVNSCFLGAPVANAVRTQEVCVANAGATFAMRNAIAEGRATGVNGDNYMREYRGKAGWDYLSALRKTGAGDLLLYDNTVTVSGPTTIENGRLILSNTVTMAVTKIVADDASRLVIAPKATATVGGLDITKGTLDLGGNTVTVGGPSEHTATFGGTLANGTALKVGTSEQLFSPGQNQADWEVYGGTLAFGVPAPVVRYDFDTAETLCTDKGRAGVTLKVTNGVSWAANGVRGGCATFAGGYLIGEDASALPGGNSAWTITLWMKANATLTDKRALVGWGNFGTGSACSGFNYFYPSLFHTCWEGADDFQSKGLGEIRSAWHHVALTYDPASGTRIYYVDGVEVDRQVKLSTRKIDTSKPFGIGGGILYSGNFWGSMDEVTIFDRTLSAAQIATVAKGADTANRGLAFAADGTARVARGASLSMTSVNQTLSSVTGGGTLALDDAIATLTTAVDAPSTLATVTGSGTLVKRGAGTLTLERASATGGAIDLQAGTLVAKGAPTDATLRDHLVAWWTFDDPADPGRDATGNGLTLTPVQGTTEGNQIIHDLWDWRNHFTKMGGAVYFDGVIANTNRCLCLAAAAPVEKIPHGKASMTYALWFKADTYCAENGVFIHFGNPASNGSNGFRFGKDSGIQTLRHYFWGVDKSATVALPSDYRAGDEFTGWHHTAFVFDAEKKQIAFYYDGALLGNAITLSDEEMNKIDVKAENLSIGWGKYGGMFKGYMDDIMIFDKALSTEEVRAVSRGFGSATGGATVTTAAEATLSVTDGTAAFGSVSGAGAVTVAEGAVLALGSGTSEIAGTLTGAGTLSVGERAAIRMAAGGTAQIGSLALAEGATLKGADGTAQTSPLVVDGKVTLPTVANVILPVPLTREARKVALVRATGGFEGSLSGWTASVTGKKNWLATLSIEGDTLYVSAYPQGLLFIVR